MRTYDYSKIGKRRRRMRLSQEALAEAAGLSRARLIEIEKGRSVPKATMLAKIANVLQVKESYFFATMLDKSTRRPVFSYKEVPPEIAEAKTRAILRLLADALRKSKAKEVSQHERAVGRSR